MGEGLSKYGRKFLINRAQALAELKTAVLVWETPALEAKEALILITETGATMNRPRAAEPLVFELKKSPTPNAFAMGVTLGRTNNNDVVVPDNSVSRFHAYFQKDAKSGGWQVVDAESKNGTWVGATKLSPLVGAELRDGARIRVGDIELVFFLPESFVQYLERKMNG
ncbi:MAG: FHA domain-containing protein, partial [Myxococcota bacterium]